MRKNVAQRQIKARNKMQDVEYGHRIYIPA